MLPPGQRAIKAFWRFGTHLHQPPPVVPANPVIEVEGDAVAEPVVMALTDLAALPRREQTSDFHCVAGWSVTGLRWEGVPFADFHRLVIEPRLRPGAAVSHFVFQGLDGYRVVVAAEDALAADALIALHLDGAPLDGDHGAPARFVSPGQYGFASAKHLCRVEVRTTEPGENFGHASALAKAVMVRPLFARHPRSRVWEEERNASLPNWLVRPVYRAFTPPIAWLSRARPKRFW